MEITNGHYWNNRNSGNTSSSSSWTGVRAYVFDQVHHKGCNCGHKKSVRDNSEADRQQQAGQRRSEKDYDWSKYNKRYRAKTF